MEQQHNSQDDSSTSITDINRTTDIQNDVLRQPSAAALKKSSNFWEDIFYPGIEENKRFLIKRYGEIINSLDLLFSSTDSLIQLINDKTTLDLPRVTFDDDKASIEDKVKIFHDIMEKVVEKIKVATNIDVNVSSKTFEGLDPETKAKLKEVFVNSAFASDNGATIIAITALFESFKEVTTFSEQIVKAEAAFVVRVTVVSLLKVVSAVPKGVVSVAVDAIFSAIFGAIEQSRLKEVKENFYKASDPFLADIQKLVESAVRTQVRLEDKFEQITAQGF